MKFPAGWMRVSPRGAATCRLQLSHTSGWRIEHCGHPTAIWPYCMKDPRGVMVVASNGRGFLTLAKAFEAHAGITAGLLQLVQVFDEPCLRVKPLDWVHP